jgi:2-succinyl-6-hydroxy-2,4-cyclohexadiene-1-carboxylate synthase
MYPHLVERLVLIGANPGIDDDDERNERRNADEALAERIEEHGVEAFLREWIRQPLFAGVNYSEEEIADRLRNTAAGLSSSLRLAGTGAQLSLWPRLRELTMPVCYVAGALDTKYVAVGRQLVAAVADGRLMTVPYAGHAVPTQAPDEVSKAIAAT